MQGMDDHQVEELIKAVRKRKVLWNLGHKNYKNVRVKAVEWENIAEELNFPVEDVKKKWRRLRDTYSRNVNKSMVSGPEADVPIGKHAASMKFLRDHLKPRPPDPTPPTTDIDTSRLDEESTSSENFDDIDPLTSTRDKSPASSPAKRRRIVRHRNRFESDFKSTMNGLKSYLDKPRFANVLSCSQTETNPLDPNMEEELFCRSMLGKLLSFPIQVRNEAKLEILGYLNDMQMRHVNGED